MKKGLILIICAGIMWGTSCVFLNLLAPYGFTSGQMTAMRITIAFFGMLLYCLIFDRGALKVKPRDIPILAICGFSLFGTAFFYYEAMQLTTASVAVVLMYISPVPIMLISVLFFAEKFTAKKGTAVVLMLIGCALVAGIAGDFKPNLLGVIMGLLSALSYTVYNVFGKLLAKRGASSVSSTLYIFIFGAVAALALNKPWEIPHLVAQRPLYLIPTVILHSLITCLLPYFAYSLSLKSLSVGVASALSIIEPMTGALLGFILYKDPLTVYTVLGIVFVISSVFLLGISENEGKHRQKNNKNPSKLE